MLGPPNLDTPPPPAKLALQAGNSRWLPGAVDAENATFAAALPRKACLLSLGIGNGGTNAILGWEREMSRTDFVGVSSVLYS